MPALEGDEEVELDPKETIPERKKLNPRKMKATATRLNILNTNKFLSRLPILSAENSSCKLKHEIIQILYLLHHYNRITKNAYNNYLNSLQWLNKIWLR